MFILCWYKNYISTKSDLILKSFLFLSLFFPLQTVLIKAYENLCVNFVQDERKNIYIYKIKQNTFAKYAKVY